MSTFHHKSRKLVVAVIVFFMSAVAIWHLDSAMTAQYQLLDGCWPDFLVVDGNNVQPESLIRSEVERRGLTGLEAFFFLRLEHHILIYFLVLTALIGWSASFFLRFLDADDTESGQSSRRPLPSWGSMLAMGLLSVIAGGIIFLLLLDECIARSSANWAAAGSIAAGTSPVLFFRWLSSLKIWSKFHS